MSTDRKTAEQIEMQMAVAKIAAEKQAERKRVIARIDAYNENLTNTARQHLYDSMQKIKTEYDAKIHAELLQAESEASESLHNLAEEFGWSLVQAAAEDDSGVHQARLLRPKDSDRHGVGDDEKEFEDSKPASSLANALYPDTEAQAA